MCDLKRKKAETDNNGLAIGAIPPQGCQILVFANGEFFLGVFTQKSDFWDDGAFFERGRCSYCTKTILWTEVQFWYELPI